ncbi:hypothetical protein XENOCAPTIV_023069 [Xenoophorus captivus]|uniref:Uncharacterized protein n=1 Tax=Xenoophorus captivus TaxID=1517983 RepID=A0ABV0QXU5_9TELE
MQQSISIHSADLGEPLQPECLDLSSLRGCCWRCSQILLVIQSGGDTSFENFELVKVLFGIDQICREFNVPKQDTLFPMSIRLKMLSIGLIYSFLYKDKA